MTFKIDGPIPGQSLTTEPGNAPWEQPPLYSSTEESLAFYMKKLNSPKKMDKLLFLLDQGFPVETFVDSLTTNGVMNGYHNIDVSTLISPVLHEYVKQMAHTAGVKCTEFGGPTEEEKEAAEFKSRLQVMLPGALSGSTEQTTPEPAPYSDVVESGHRPGIIRRRKS